MITQHQVFQIFGHITVFYATLDFLISAFIIEILTDSYKRSHKPFDSSSTLGKKFHYIKNIQKVDVISERILADAHSIIDEALDIANERNRFIHDNWMFSPNDLINDRIRRTTITLEDSWNFKVDHSEAYTEHDLTQLLQRIGQLQMKFGDMLDLLKHESN